MVDLDHINIKCRKMDLKLEGRLGMTFYNKECVCPSFSPSRFLKRAHGSDKYVRIYIERKTYMVDLDHINIKCRKMDLNFGGRLQMTFSK